MIKEGLISDQLFNWSDNARINIYRSISTTLFVVKAVDKVKTQHSKRISNREIQTLWESRMSLYEGRTRTWSQVLFICKLSKSQAQNDLHSFGQQEESRGRVEELSKSQRDFRRDQQGQSRIIKTQRTIIKREWPGLPRYQLIYRRWQLW